MEMTIIVQENDGWFIGQLAEYPGAIDQARSMTELKERLTEAFFLLLETEREQTIDNYRQEGEQFTTEKLYVRVKRNDLLKHLSKNGCILLREGANHTIYRNPQTGQQTAVLGGNRNLIIKSVEKFVNS